MRSTIAWEFLRRNPEYQDLWDKWVEPYFNPVNNVFDGDRMMDDFEKSGLKLQKNRDSRETCKIKSPLRIFKDKFRILSVGIPPCYKNAQADWLWPEHHSIKFWKADIRGEAESQITIQLDENEIAIAFNLDLPLKLQIKKVGKFLLEQSKKEERKDRMEKPKHRNKFKMYHNYIRLLDAKTQGAKPRDIASTLFPEVPNDYSTEDKRISDSFIAAKKVRDKHYLYID